MTKRGKLKTLKNITLVFPSSSRRFRCHYAKNVKDIDHLVWGFFHKLEDRDSFFLCEEQGCNDVVCQRHYPQHQEWHLLSKLGGTKK